MWRTKEAKHIGPKAISEPRGYCVMMIYILLQYTDYLLNNSAVDVVCGHKSIGHWSLSVQIKLNKQAQLQHIQDSLMELCVMF